MDNEIVVLENEKFKVVLMSLGAILQKFIVKKAGVDIVLGFNEKEAYLQKNSASMGKSIGRCANRIGNATFTLDGVTYNLLANNGPNSLHGGEVKWGDLVWEVKEKTEEKVTFVYRSKDMEAGYPGNVDVTATYELMDTGLKVTYEGMSDKDTIFNMTNHSYFNLDKNKTNILNHYLKVNADRVNLNDSNGMAQEESVNVVGTAFDFLDFKRVGDVVGEDGKDVNSYCDELKKNISNVKINNIDNNFLTEKMGEKVLCELKNNEFLLKVISNLPNVQVYTGRTINADGKEGKYLAYCGIAMEPQFCPNAINYTKYMKPILKKGEKASYFIKYELSSIE